MIEFTVYGTPAQVGSKNSYVPLDKQGNPYRRDNGGVMVQTVDSNRKSKPWMAAVRAAAAEAYHGELLTGPVRISIVFHFPRPKSHFRKGGELTKSAPHYHTQTPDLAKLVRCLEDALTGIVWRDDKQVCEYRFIEKRWTCRQARAEVEIEEIGPGKIFDLKEGDSQEISDPVQTVKP